MTRVTHYRITYVALLALLAGGVYFALRAAGDTRLALAIAIVLLLIPGRLQGLFFRPLFRGQKHLTQGNSSGAMHEFETFLSLLERQPWRKWALWLGWSLYTPSAKAMGFNNLGVAHAELGNESQAKTSWDRALAIDPLYPVPYANLAALAASEGNAEKASELLAQAKQLGYTGGALDQATHRVQQLLAAIESHGPSV